MRPKLVVSDLQPAVVGDVNGDGRVNVLDLLLLAYGFGTRCGVDRAYDPRADFNGDSYVDLGDLLVLAAHWPSS